MFKININDINMFEVENYLLKDGCYVILDDLQPYYLNNTEVPVHIQGKLSLDEARELINSKVIDMIRLY